MKKIPLIMIAVLLMMEAKAQSASPVAEKYWSWMFPQYSMMCPPFIEHAKKPDTHKRHTKQIMEYSMMPADSDSIHRIGILNEIINIKFDSKGREIERNYGDKNTSSISRFYYSHHSRTDSFNWLQNYLGVWYTSTRVENYKYNRHRQLLSYQRIYCNTYYHKPNYIYNDIAYFQYNAFHRLINEKNAYDVDTIGQIKNSPYAS